jgi:hypothetical protein
LVRTHDPRDAGQITVGRAALLAGLVLIVAVIFLQGDIRHRIAGYEAVHSNGILGTVTVTSCSADTLGTTCHGDFSSEDGTLRLHHLTVNGPSGLSKTTLPTTIPAAVTGPRAHEAWSVTGDPWWRPSIVQFAALVPVALALAYLWSLLLGGPTAWRAQAGMLRTLRDQERLIAHREEVRRGHVH